MKALISLSVMILITFSTLTYAQNQLPEKGFFVGGGLLALMTNGSGEVDLDTKKDFEVTDGLLKFVNQSEFQILDGLSWESKIMYGICPVVGYRMNKQLGIQGAYIYNLVKKGEESEQNVDAESEYTQRGFQILGQFFPTNENYYILAGMEFLSLEVEASWSGSIERTIEVGGKDKVSGLVFGGGIEMPLESLAKNASFYANVLYSLAKYDGGELLEVDGSSELDLELKVGGFSAMAGVRLYLSK